MQSKTRAESKNKKNNNENNSNNFKWKKFFLAKGTENKDSTARDSLANERTFLSWIRTCVALILLGIGSVRIEISTELKVDGYIIIAFGILVGIFGSYRYLEVEYYLEKQQYPRARIEVLVFSLLVLGMGISILVIVIITTKYIPLPTISIIP